MHIIGDVDRNRIYCTGSFTKLLTTYVSLSLLSEKYDLNKILDDENFLDEVCTNPASKNFLKIFQNRIGSRFTLRDICTYYTGLPYTFDLSDEELKTVEAGQPFKHHSITDEDTFLMMCRAKITQIYPNRSKFHYSEISILFLGYLIEKIHDIKMEDLYEKYVIGKCQLKNSYFSRKIVENTYCQDLSDKYDYPSIAILNHGYFCYSNGFYTTLNDMKVLIESLLEQPVFKYMVDIEYARAASNRLMNGLTIELRLHGEDLLYGYEGLSFSGCNIWVYSTKHKKGFLTLTNDEEKAYDIVYGQFGYSDFDIVPDHTQKFYKQFIKNYRFSIVEKDIPGEYQGNYHRVKINEKELKDIFIIGNNFIVIRNPDEAKYDAMYVHSHYSVRSKDNVQGSTVGLYMAESGNKYMLFDGTLYKKIT